MKMIKKSVLISLSAAALSLPLLVEAASHRKIVYIDQYDQNLDGRVSSIEFETARRARFDITDSNQNAQLDIDEYVFEWEDRMDAQLAFDRKEQVEQTATRFSSLDTDSSGIISWQEFEASGLWSFNRFDSNKDGMVNADDIDEMASQVADSDNNMSREQILHDNKRMLAMPSTHSKQGTLTQYDADDDGVATTAEFNAGRLAFHKLMDENGDGDITPDEYLGEFENRLDAAISHFRKESIEQAIVRFNALDKDDNAVMTFEEYQVSGHRSFKRWDTDEDGYITLEEEDPAEPEFSQQQVNEENQSA